MSNVEEKKDLVKLIDIILEKEFIKNNEKFTKEFQDLRQDIEEDFFTVLVLGEFKRGKSTLINALIKNNLLITDVLPETAVISAIAYSDSPSLEVLKQDGSTVKGEASEAFLKQFSAKGNVDPNTVKYIKIGYPADFLMERMVIVDTPGVDDINEQRCEVTYNFLPKAHAVLFVLDANSPLKNTEKEFIENRLIPLGINNIVFVVNKYDNVDDEEEEEDLLEAIKNRIADAFQKKKEELTVIPVSSKWALNGYIKNDSRMINASGIEHLKKELQNISYYGETEKTKIKMFQRRFKNIVYDIISELENQRALKLVDIGQLKSAKEQIEQIYEDTSADKSAIVDYVEKQKPIIKQIVDKSLMFFYRRIEDDIISDIRYYKGSDFKDYVEQRVAKNLKRSMENWIASYSPYVEQLLENLEREISSAISLKFQQKVSLQSASENNIGKSNFNFDFLVDDVSKSYVKAGVIGAGGIIGLTWLFGGGLLAPMISMAAFPYMRDKMLEEKLNEAKDKIIPVVEDQLAQYISTIKNEINSCIDRRCELIVNNSEESYELLLTNISEMVKQELDKKDSLKYNFDNIVRDLTSQIKELEACVVEL